MECIWWWLDSWEFPAIMLDCLQDMPTTRVVQLNDWLFAWRVKLLSIFSWPPCMIAHTFLLFWALYYGIFTLHPIHAPLTAQIKSNQIKPIQNSILLRSSSFFPLYLLTFSCKKEHLPLSPLSEISCRFLLACLTTTPPSHAMAGMDRWSKY